MNQQQAFLEDIAEHPDDDAPRLIFADWLDDHDDPDRAEFIRSQVESDRLDVYDADLAARTDREQQLQKKYEKKWLGTLHSYLKEWTFRRGLLDEAEIRVEQLLKHGRQLARHPVRTLHLRFEPGDEDRAGEIARCEALANVQRLHIGAGSRLTVAALRELCDSPHLGAVRHLDLTSNGLRAESVEALVNSSLARRLESLDLSTNSIGVNGCEAFARATGLDRLVTLELSASGLTAAGVQILCASRHLPRLQTLDLSEMRLDASAARALAACPRLKDLRRLNLAGASIGHDGAAALARSVHLRKLECLELRSNSIGKGGVTEFAKGGFLDSMRYLCLSGNNVGEAGIRELVKARPKCLEFLLFGTDDLTDDAMKMLARWPALEHVRELNLYSNRVTAFGLRALFDSPYAKSLCRMNLERNELKDLGAQVLAVWPGLEQMRWLKLRSNDITDEGALALAHSPHLKMMNDLDLSSNELTAESKKAFTTPPVRERIRRVAPWDESQIGYHPPYAPQRPRG